MKLNFEIIMVIITTLEESSRIRGGNGIFTYSPETMLDVTSFLRNIMKEKKVNIEEENETL